MDHPRLLRDAEVVHSRHAQVDEDHVAPLNAWVRSVRSRLGDEAIVPLFDPWDGGIDGRVLWLLEAPGPRATVERGGSGFVSCNNVDATAENTWRTREEAGVPRAAVVHWNAIPFYLGSDVRIRPPGDADVATAGPLITELLALLPAVRAVILGGRAAQRAWDAHGHLEGGQLDVAADALDRAFGILG